MMKKIGIILALLFFAGSVFAFPAPHATLSTTISLPYLSVPNVLPQPKVLSNDGWYFWQMMKMNRENNFVSTPPRGMYNFKTRTWLVN